MPFPEQQASRRAVVTGLASLAGLTVAGCSSDTDLSNLPGLPDRDEAPRPDIALLSRVVRDEERLWTLIGSTRDRHASLRRTLRGAEAVHQAHLERLATSVAGGGRTRAKVTRSEAPHVAKDPQRALADVVAAERALARKHAASALEAQSGALARVIASMSAAAAQQGSVLGAASPKGGSA